MGYVSLKPTRVKQQDYETVISFPEKVVQPVSRKNADRERLVNLINESRIFIVCRLNQINNVNVITFRNRVELYLFSASLFMLNSDNVLCGCTV